MPVMNKTLRANGFTLLELMIALTILAIILAVGIPNMRNWVFANKVASAAHFYAEGLGIARNQALSHNSASRLVLVKNVNGQSDWRVDICFPRPGTPCTAASGSWSTTTAPAALDPEGVTGFKSVLRSADSLPPSTQLVQTVEPEDATAVYFTPLGWVNSSVTPRIERIGLKPAAALEKTTPPVAVVLTLAGIATRCKPDAVKPDPQRCPPTP